MNARDAGPPSVSRRGFLRRAAVGSAGLSLTPWGLRAFGQAADDRHLVILHTNDTHSRLDPFPEDAGRNAGLGGAARRAHLVERIRAENEHVLLLDSGDIWQGTPYFNLFGGEVEFQVMSEMRYDVATLGNHDFDNGTEGLVAMLPHAEFDFVSANYQIDHPDLAARVMPWTIRELDGITVGIFGLGIDFHALVLDELHEGVHYRDPVGAARRASEALRDQGCDLVICLSHLGYRYDQDRPSDLAIAQTVPEVDVILGGHTHTFMDRPDVFRAGTTDHTIVHQVGFGGLRLGRIDVTFGPSGELRASRTASLGIGPRLGRA